MNSWWSYLKQIFMEPPEAPECDHWRASPDPARPEFQQQRHTQVGPVGGVGTVLGNTTRRAPTRDAFKAWRDDPVTRFAFDALAVAAEAQKAAWVEVSWEGREADKDLLIELHTRADAYRSLQEAEYEAFCEWLMVDPEPLPDETVGGVG